MNILITGGAGFIGSALIRYLINDTVHKVINVDKLNYASNLESLTEVETNSRYYFEKCDICDSLSISEIFRKHNPSVVINLAAESHVDRSIEDPKDFIQNNIMGTFYLLEQTRVYYEGLNEAEKGKFLFHHVSTDEVYGDLEEAKGLFTETTPYTPSSPYSASKASSDHLVRSWDRTYGIPTIVTNCSNNYGPFHFPEKLIPHIILNALKGKSLPVYGDGLQVRDWLYVDDHAKALVTVMTKGKVGETYNIGGHNQKKNIEVVEAICDLLEELAPEKPEGVSSYKDLITFVGDRPGHDRHYAIDAAKIKSELGWIPEETFETGLRKTVLWYLNNTAWWERILSGSYRLERLGG